MLVAYQRMMSIFQWWTNLLMLAGRSNHLYRDLVLLKVSNSRLDFIVNLQRYLLSEFIHYKEKSKELFLLKVILHCDAMSSFYSKSYHA